MDLQEECLIEVELEKVRVNPWQPRKVFNEVEIAELAESIKAIGLIQPPVVRRAPEGGYELVAGERRLRALHHAGYKKAPFVLKKYSTSASAHAALIENLQRSDLNAIEVAEALRVLMVQGSLTQEMVAKKVGKRRSTVANYLRLLQLPLSIQDYVRDGSLTMGHAKALLSLPEKDQESYCRKIVEKRLSVREAERGARKKNTQESIFVVDLEERLSKWLGSRVKVKDGGNKGSIEIQYEDLDHLDRILERLQG